MDWSVIKSKLDIPTLRQRIVPRPRLQIALEQSVIRYKLALVSAPAGYGKTTLLAEWARASSLPIAWLSITREEDDVGHFLRYLLAAWETVQPEITQTSLGLLLQSQTPDIQAVLPVFVNAGEQAPNHVVFVLDDYHLIKTPAIHEVVNLILEHLPPKLHFILATRSEPPLPLARYRAHGQLLELRADELRFTHAESADFLSQVTGLQLSPNEVASLHADTEGWIAGLQLAALMLRRREPGTNTLPHVSGKQRFIADYLAEDVLNDLPAEQQSFLLKTSILDRFCGSLCDAVTEGESGQEMLEVLERENLFLESLDDSRVWRRYHQLFADFLREALRRRYPDEAAHLHRRAAQWYLAHDLPEQAFHHAAAAEDTNLVMRIGEHYFEIKLLSGEFNVLKQWLDSLPEQWSTDYPLVGLFRAGVYLFTGELDAGTRCLDEIERTLALSEGEETRQHLAQVTAIRCTVACFQNDLPRAETYADRALQELAEEDHTFRAAVYHALGDTYRRNGHWEQARACYLHVLTLVHEPAYRIRSVHAFGALADLELQQGQLRNSAAYWRKALAIIQAQETWGSFPLPLIGWVYIRLGEILYEWNELSEAGDHLSRGLERAELGGDVRAMMAGYLMAGRLRLAAGDIAAASEYLERARRLVENALFPDWTSRFERLQFEVWLAQGRLRVSMVRADEMLGNDASESQPESEIAQLAIARVLIVKGDMSPIEQALALLDGLLQAGMAGRMGIQIEALALQAMADWRRGERAGAMTSLEHALRLAEPEGYVRVFADLGLPMIRLLQEARSRDVMPDYVETLLTTCGADIAFPATEERTLPEPLTHREQEILQLVAAGLTNREIAERLVVSPETVKKHTSNIYGKLGVRSRAEAGAQARKLDLLD